MSAALNGAFDLQPPTRIQLRRTKGWRMPPNARSVARPTAFGNPYKAGICPPKWPKDTFTAEDAVACFKLLLAGGWLLKRPPGYTIVRRAMDELEGMDLACWCPLDAPCHGDVLLQYANAAVALDGTILGVDA